MTIRISNFKIVTQTFRFDFLKAKALSYMLAGVFLTVPANCFAADVSFSPAVNISHPDKKVSSPSIASDKNGRLYIAWAREDNDRANIYITGSLDGGKTFSKEVMVNPKGMGANGILASPTIAVGTNDELYVLWSSPKANKGSNILLSRSVNYGKTFEMPVVVNDVQSPVSRGFESMTVGKDGIIHVVWFDGRITKPISSDLPLNIFSREIYDKDGGKFIKALVSYPIVLVHSKKAGVTGTYYTRSIDGGKTFGKNIKLDENTCPCCRASIVSDAQGNIYASWRKVFEGDIRDIVVARSGDNGKTFSEPVIVSEDKWAIAGCPHRGPSLGTDQNSFLYITWYTEGAEGAPSVYFAVSKDNAKTFSKRRSIANAKSVFPDHPKLAVRQDGRVFFVWEETTPVFSRIFFRYFDGEKVSEPVQINDGVRKAHDPAITIDKFGDIIIAWSYEEIRFTKAVLKIGKEKP